MLRIIRVTDESFKVVSDGISKNHANRVMTLTETFITMSKLGVTLSEIEMGIVDLVTNDYDYAEYGIGLMGNGPTFIYSSKH